MAEDGLTSGLPLRRGLFLDLADETGDLLLLLLRGKDAPTRQGREGHRLAGREAVSFILLATAESTILLGALDVRIVTNETQRLSHRP